VDGGQKIRIMSRGGCNDDGVVKRLRVMTYNIHHGEGVDGVFDLARIAEAIRKARVDIAGLQEVDRWFGPRSRWVDGVGFLGERLEMYVLFGPALKIPTLRPRHPWGYFGNAILSRYPILQGRNVVMKRIGTRENRAFLHAAVALGEATHPLNFIVTHLGLSGREREVHVRNILNYLRDLSGPKILVGDWNEGPDSPAVMAVRQEMVDVVASCTEPGVRHDEVGHGGVDGYHIKPRVDYIFTSPDIRIEGFEVLPSPASDHFPVIATVYCCI